MALYLGKDLVSASSGLGGSTIKNQDKNITENGSYSADSGYTGLGIVKVDVQPKNQDKNITANGTYRADSGYTGLGEVTVDVPPTPPNNQDITVTENGTYTAENGYTGLGTVTVDVPTGGGASVSPKDVNFYDYDGTILHSYTVEEAQALTELPELPTQKGLICQGWNYDLATIKAHNRALNIGATYITDDGKTRLYIKIAAEGRMTVPIYFSQTVANGVTIDWGDGSATETLSGTGNVNTSHTYASIGDYVISLDVAEGCSLGFGNGTSSYSVLGYVTDGTKYEGMVYGSMLRKVEIGTGVTTITTYAFRYCISLTSVTIPDSVKDIETRAFTYCYALDAITIPYGTKTIQTSAFERCNNLKHISIPNSVLSIGQKAFYQCVILTSVNFPNSVTNIVTSAFYYCYALTSVILPNNIMSITNEVFAGCYSLASITIPNKVTSLGNQAFASCYGMKVYDFTTHTTIPTLSTAYVFMNIPSDCQIRVPASLYDEWIAATNWSNFASQIVAV